MGRATFSPDVEVCIKGRSPVKNGNVEMSIRESAFVTFVENARLKELQAYFVNNTTTQLQRVTADFVHKPLTCDGDVSLACCAVLAKLEANDSNDLKFQAMSVTFHTNHDQITTRDGSRLFMPTTMER